MTRPRTAPGTGRIAALSALAFGPALLLAACLPLAQGADPSGRDLYADYCAACHGTSGKGDGIAQAGLNPKAPDLTGLAARNDGTFPLVAVMAKVYGTADGKSLSGGPMPVFGPLLEGPTVLVETDPGVMTPTPARLVAVAEHVARLGRR